MRKYGAFVWKIKKSPNYYFKGIKFCEQKVSLVENFAKRKFRW